MSSYALSSGVYFFSGAKRGAVYDTNLGKVYSVNSTGRQILEGSIPNDGYWQQLVSIGLAVTTIDERRISQTLPQFHEKLRFVWFELVSDACNNCCVHCYAGSRPVARKNRKVSKLTYKQWVSLMDQSIEIGCRRCQLIGGEPFLYKGERGESVLDLAEYARKIGFEVVEIFTNATLLTAKRVAKIKELGLRVAVSLYSNDLAVHDAITQREGSYSSTVNGLRLLQEAGVRTRVEVVAMSINQHTLPETPRFIEELGFGEAKPDPIRQVGRGSNPQLLPDPYIFAKYGLKLKPDFKTSMRGLARNLNGNPCLNGKIAITDRGLVYPCVFSRSFEVGDVGNGVSLGEVIEGNKLQSVWHAS